MKKIYSLIFASAFALVSVNANAVTIPVTVGGTGDVFTPSGFTANIGDVVTWTWAGGTHNVTSFLVPAGAATFASATQTTGTYSYTITTGGSYGYECTIHAGSGMIGGFTVSATGIAQPATDLLTNVYPNPFKDKLSVKFGTQIDMIKFFNIVGEEVKSVNLTSSQDEVEVNFEGFAAGIYFMRTYKDEAVLETKKIIKTK